MGQSPDTSEYASLIGDIVASREAEDRRQLHELVREVLRQVNTYLPFLQPLSPTVGDEFQGVYQDLSSAVQATLLLRLSLTNIAEVRFGIGWGPLAVFEEESLPFEQDGPAWWAARDAIERVSFNMRQKEGPRGWRTAFLISDSAGGETAKEGAHLHQMFGSGKSYQNLLNGFLMCRDEIVAGMDERDARITLALLRKKRQRDIAQRENISQSAVAQRISRSGAYALVHAYESLMKEN